MNHIHSKHRVITPGETAGVYSSLTVGNKVSKRSIWQTVSSGFISTQTSGYIHFYFVQVQKVYEIHLFSLKKRFLHTCSFPDLVPFSFSRAEIFDCSLWHMSLGGKKKSCPWFHSHHQSAKNSRQRIWNISNSHCLWFH